MCEARGLISRAMTGVGWWEVSGEGAPHVVLHRPRGLRPPPRVLGQSHQPSSGTSCAPRTPGRSGLVPAAPRSTTTRRTSPDDATRTRGSDQGVRRSPWSARRSRPTRTTRSRAAGRPGPSRRPGPGRTTSEVSASAKSATYCSGSSGVPVPSVACSIGTSSPVSPSHDDLGDAAGRGRDDGGLAGHRLEVDDAERLVDRRADEHGRGGQQRRRRRRAGSISRIQTTPLAGLRASSSTRPSTSATISGVSGAPAQSTSWTSGGSVAAGAQEERQALLPRDPADEHHRRPVGVDALPRDPRRGRRRATSSRCRCRCGRRGPCRGRRRGRRAARRRASPPTPRSPPAAPRYDVRSANDESA